MRLASFLVILLAVQGRLAAQRTKDPEMREKQASSVRASGTPKPKPAPIKAPRSTVSSGSELSKIESSGIKAVGHPHTTARPAHAATPKAQAPANHNKPIKFAYHKAPATKPVSGTSQSSKPH